LKFNKNINISQINKKIINTLIQLSIYKILIIFLKISNYLYNQIWKCHISLIIIFIIFMIINIINILFIILNINININYLKYTKIIIDHIINIYILLDNKSEFNIISQYIFDYMNLSIDMKIHWRIDKYDSKINIKLNKYDLINIYHDIFMNIDNIIIK